MQIRRRLALATLAMLLLVAACGSGDDDDAEVEPRETGSTAYVALGDSISAGGGAPPYDEESGRCSRSDAGFPILVDEALVDVQLTSFPACGGATIDSLLTDPTFGFPPQVPRAPQPDVGLVTVTIGANDLGYGVFLITCLVADCAIDNPAGAASFERRLDGLRARLADELYPELLRAYPNARILHVTYPRFVTQRPTGLCPWLTVPEQELIDGALVRIHRAIADAVDELGDPRVELVDAVEVTQGHEICTSEPWMVALDQTDGGHPNERGYEALAAYVTDAIES